MPSRRPGPRVGKTGLGASGQNLRLVPDAFGRFGVETSHWAAAAIVTGRPLGDALAFSDDK